VITLYRSLQATAISLLQITGNLLLIEPDFEGDEALKIRKQMEKESLDEM